MKKVCKGIISSGFGMRKHPITRKKSMHNGVDIACPRGTDVLSPTDGVVIDVYHHTKGGLTVIIKGDDNIRYGFCHLETAFVVQGSSVIKGMRFAATGNSGMSTGPHLHFSQQRNGIWQNPQIIIEE